MSPIAEPKLPAPPKTDGEPTNGAKEEDVSMEPSDEDGDDDEHLEERRKAELERLHKLGVPVPGVLIKVDKMEAKVWLEDLDVESNHKLFADRVRAVVDRACETIAPLWGN